MTDIYRYNFPLQARSRLLYALDAATKSFGNATFNHILQELDGRLRQKYGGLVAASYEAARQSDNPVLEHFYKCDDDQVVYFIEQFFACFHYNDDRGGVAAVNAVLQEEQIGWEFTPWKRHIGEPVKTGHFRGGLSISHDYPKAVKKSDQYLHEQTVKPAFELLADSRFKTANDEMLKAHEDFKRGDFAHALTSCGAAFESVLRTICALKAYPPPNPAKPFDLSKLTTGALVELCKANGLFPDLIKNNLLDSGRIRNEMASAHGRAHTGQTPPTREYVEYMFRITSAQLLLLVGLAKL